MKKNFLFTPAVASVLLLLLTTSCSNDTPENVEVQKLEAKKVINDPVTEKLALILNQAVQNDKSLLSNIQKKTVKQFDGDYDVLIADIFSNNKTKSSSNNSIVRSIQKASSATGVDNSELSELIDKVLKENPLLQIYMPDWGDLSQYDDFLVVIQPENANDTEGYELIAFNKKGEKVLLSSKVEPQLPYLVIGQNERVDLNNKNDFIGSSIIESPYFVYSLNKNILNLETKENDIKAQKVLAKSATATKRSAFDFNSYEVITMAKFMSKQAIQNVEPWGRGKPEVECRAYYQQYGSLTDIIFQANSYIPINMGEDNWYKGSRTWSFGGWGPKPKYGDWYVFRWTKDALLTKMKYIFMEKDGGFSVTANVSGADIGVSVSNGDLIGSQFVYFTDELDKTYMCGNMFQFTIDQKK